MSANMCEPMPFLGRFYSSIYVLSRWQRLAQENYPTQWRQYEDFHTTPKLYLAFTSIFLPATSVTNTYKTTLSRKDNLMYKQILQTTPMYLLSYSTAIIIGY